MNLCIGLVRLGGVVGLDRVWPEWVKEKYCVFLAVYSGGEDGRRDGVDGGCEGVDGSVENSEGSEVRGGGGVYEN